MRRPPRFTRAIARSSPDLLLLAAMSLTLGGCATTAAPPSQALQAAELAIAGAEKARVADYASNDLATARQKLAAARTAVMAEQMVEAEYLAIESRAHAEVALVRAEELKAKAVHDEMKQSIETLKTEMQRASGAGQ